MTTAPQKKAAKKAAKKTSTKKAGSADTAGVVQSENAEAATIDGERPATHSEAPEAAVFAPGGSRPLPPELVELHLRAEAAAPQEPDPAAEATMDGERPAPRSEAPGANDGAAVFAPGGTQPLPPELVELHLRAEAAVTASDPARPPDLSRSDRARLRMRRIGGEFVSWPPK